MGEAWMRTVGGVDGWGGNGCRNRDEGEFSARRKGLKRRGKIRGQWQERWEGEKERVRTRRTLSTHQQGAVKVELELADAHLWWRTFRVGTEERDGRGCGYGVICKEHDEAISLEFVSGPKPRG